MILYQKHPKDPQKNHLDIMNSLSKVSGQKNQFLKNQ
jgi:hypothetical protein